MLDAGEQLSLDLLQIRFVRRSERRHKQGRLWAGMAVGGAKDDIFRAHAPTQRKLPTQLLCKLRSPPDEVGGDEKAVARLSLFFVPLSEQQHFCVDGVMHAFKDALAIAVPGQRHGRVGSNVDLVCAQQKFHFRFQLHRLEVYIT